MDQGTLIAAANERFADDPALVALFLGGGFGRGDADEYGHVDLIALVPPAGREAFAARWRSALETILPITFWHGRTGARTLMSAVGDDWLRCDMFVVALHLGRTLPPEDMSLLASLPSPAPERDAILAAHAAIARAFFARAPRGGRVRGRMAGGFRSGRPQAPARRVGPRDRLT